MDLTIMMKIPGGIVLRMIGLTSAICRNLKFYQNDTKIRRKLAYEIYSCVQLLGCFAPRPPDQGLCPWTSLEHSPQTPIIGSGYRDRHNPPNAKPNSAYGRFTHLGINA